MSRSNALFLYVRVSTEQQDFQHQKLAAESFMQTKPDFFIAKSFEEKSSSYNQIPFKMIELINEIENINPADRPNILVKNVDRFSRSVDYGTQCLEKILSLGIGIFFFARPDINVSTPEGRAKFDMDLREAENESKKISDRVLYSLSVRRDAGYMISKEPPFGKKLIVNENKKMEPCREEVFVQGLIAMFNGDYTSRQILKAIRQYEITVFGHVSELLLYGENMVNPINRNEIFYGTDSDFAYILNYFKIYKRDQEWTARSINYQWKKYIEPIKDQFENGLAASLELIDDQRDEDMAELITDFEDLI